MNEEASIKYLIRTKTRTWKNNQKMGLYKGK